MSTNKKLPMVKLFLYPIIAATAYGAYCYYYEQYNHERNKVNAPVKYMQQLKQILNECQNIEELKRVYDLMAKHIDTFLVDPSSRWEKIAEHHVDREIQNKISLTNGFKIQNQYQINIFNSKIQKKDGKFTLGLWTNLNKTVLWRMKSADALVNIAEKSIKMRQNKCQTIARNASNELSRGYLQEYIECIGATTDDASHLQRQIDLAKKILRYQLIN